MNIPIKTLFSSIVSSEGVVFGTAVVVPTLAQDVVARLADNSLNQINNGNLRTIADLALRFTASIVTAGAMAYALSLPLATVLTINALFIATIGTYTVFCGNSFTIEIDQLLYVNRILWTNLDKLEKENQQMRDDNIKWMKKANSQERQAELFRQRCRELSRKSL